METDKLSCIRDSLYKFTIKKPKKTQQKPISTQLLKSILCLNPFETTKQNFVGQ